MYALANVEKFLRDKADRVGDKAEAILARAKEHSGNGVFPAGSVEEIMGSTVLACEFRIAVASDHDHFELGSSAMQAAFR